MKVFKKINKIRKINKIKKKFIFNKKNKSYRNLGYLYVKSTLTNIYVTFTDVKGKVVICVTSGSSGILGNKRRKKTPMAAESICRKLYTYLRLYKIKQLHVFSRKIKTSIMHRLIAGVIFRGIKVKKFTRLRYYAHNGVRARKIRRP